MKEYLKKISLVLATCTFLFSCDKFLEENPKDKLPEDDVYNSISEVYLNAVASLYTYVGGYSDSQGLQGTGRGVYDLNTFTTDEAIIPTRGGDWYDGGFWQGLFLHDWGIENDAIQATWEYLYKVVMLSNKSLERIDKFAETHSDAELPAYRAEVRAMRAMYYYYLLDLIWPCAFGAVFFSCDERHRSKRAEDSIRIYIQGITGSGSITFGGTQQSDRALLWAYHSSGGYFLVGKTGTECRSLYR